MRQPVKKQLKLESAWLPFDHSRELQAIGRLLDANATLAELVWQDLAPKGLPGDTGAIGLSAEQVNRMCEEFGIYAVSSGRICLAALNTHNIDYVADAIAAVL